MSAASARVKRECRDTCILQSHCPQSSLVEFSLETFSTLMAGGAAPERYALVPTQGAVHAATATQGQKSGVLQEGEPSLQGNPRAAKENVEKIFFKNDEDQKLQNAATSFGPALPSSLPSENCDEFGFVMDLMKHDLARASLNILSNRQNDLVQQRRCLDDEIAKCEMNIRAILTEQGTVRENVVSMIKACDALFRSQLPMPVSCSNVRNHAQETKVKRLSEANLGSKNYYQELDDICGANGWKLPVYNVFPSTVYGSYQTGVTVRGIDFETYVRGECKSSPNEARSSAAEKMLGKIRCMVDKRTTG